MNCALILRQRISCELLDYGYSHFTEAEILQRRKFDFTDIPMEPYREKACQAANVKNI